MDNTEIVDDEYWLKYAKSITDNSISTVNDAAVKLETAAKTIWGVYSAGYVTEVVTKVFNIPFWLQIFLALPIVILIYTYWSCTKVQMPVVSAFDPRIPEEIRNSYIHVLGIKNRHFQNAFVSTFVFVLVFAISLFLLAILNQKSAPASSFSGFYGSNKNVLIVSGEFPQNIVVTTTIDSIYRDTTDKSTKKNSFYSNIYKIQENGILNLNLTKDLLLIQSFPDTVFITVSWLDNNIEKGLTQKIIR